MPTEDKKFTQADMTAAVMRAKRDWEAEQNRLQKEISDRDTIIGIAKGRIAELESTTASALEEERAAHAATVDTHRRYHRDVSLTKALEEGKVLKVALRHALRLLPEEFELQEDVSGAVTGATRRSDGKQFETLAQATQAFLRENPHMQAVTFSGGGTIPPGANPYPRKDPFGSLRADPTAQNPVDLINKGLKAPTDHH